MSQYDQSIFRAYDMRGTYPAQMNEQVAYAAGQAFVQVMGAKKIAVGRDVRSSGVPMQEAMIKGITEAGADVIEIGVISTEMLYFAAGALDCDGGLSLTASHNPPQWNGIKVIGKGALPITREGDLGKIYDFINAGTVLTSETVGTVEQVDLLSQYITYLQKFIPADLPHLKIAANPNFGANGKIVDALTKNLPLELARLNWNEDGTFPKGTPDPLLPHNRKEISEFVVSQGADFGVAWDADADRCFFYDEKGRFFHGYYVTAMMIKHFLQAEPGACAVIERRLVWANYDAAKENGGEVKLSRTGHGYFKKSMRDTGAIFGGEMSGHFYYRDFFCCDNGILTFLTALGIFAKQIKEGGTVSQLLDWYLEKYPILQQEQNYKTPRAKEIIDALSVKYSDSIQDTGDGVSIEYPTWRMNLRMSDNEPVMRMNLEAHTQEELEQKHQELHAFVTAEGAVLRDDTL